MPPNPLRLYTAFHLNMAYSSIEEEDRADLVQRCYWPLLKLAKEKGLSFGIEATGFTLETVQDLDPGWVRELRSLVTSGRCEFIGSGYAQVIGPLVPAQVNRRNQALGLRTYKDLLGVRPRIALVNEMAYSSGLVPLYKEAGYEALIMEWDNAASTHPEWDRGMRYFPQIALGPNDEAINVLWAKSLAFQQFQRYVHGERTLEEYLDYLGSHVGPEARAFPLYTNDVEVFDYRPGRYHTEATLERGVEWERIASLMDLLVDDPRFELVAPSQVLALLDSPQGGHPLRLESAELPVPVKKQGKYNALRWAVTGRNDHQANTECWRIYKALSSRQDVSEDQWKHLLELWSSDYRTHITESRWKAHQARLRETAAQLGVPEFQGDSKASSSSGKDKGAIHVEKDERFLQVKTPTVKIRFNTRRGLAVDRLSFLGDEPLCGTLPHGFYEEIRRGADWYSGHVVFEGVGQPKVADLNPVQELTHHEGKNGLTVNGTIDTPLGMVEKEFLVSATEPSVVSTVRLKWPEIPPGRLRLGHVTLDPRSYDRDKLRYRTTNGGASPEIFSLKGTAFDHGQAVSFLVSGSTCIGMTDGWVEIGDARRGLRIIVDRAISAAVGMIAFEPVDRDSFFGRFCLSVREIDDTSRRAEWPRRPLEVSMRLEPQRDS